MEGSGRVAEVVYQSQLPTTRVLARCEAVSCAYPSVDTRSEAVLVDLSLAIHEGDFVCVLGPSGCGKTTLLNLFAGFLHPIAGEVCFDDKPVTGPGSDRGVVFQEYSLFSWLSVRDNVEFGLRIAGVPPAQRKEKALRWLELVGLSGVAGKYPFELSGGMKQRVAIARAMVNQPRLLLMDEPFSALDALTRSTLQQELLGIRAVQPGTILFITHNIGEAIFLADRVVVMAAKPGRIVDDFRVNLGHPRRRTAPAFNEFILRVEGALGLVASD